MARFGSIVHRLRAAAKHPYMDNTCKLNVFDVAEAADRIEALEKALGDLNAAINTARDTIPDEDEGLAADVFAKYLNAAQLKAHLSLRSSRAALSDRREEQEGEA